MHPVFISYAREASAVAAKALHDALPGQCFLDDPEIEVGDTFPERIIDALLGSWVVVLWAERDVLPAAVLPMPPSVFSSARFRTVASSPLKSGRRSWTG